MREQYLHLNIGGQMLSGREMWLSGIVAIGQPHNEQLAATHCLHLVRCMHIHGSQCLRNLAANNLAIRLELAA